MKLPNKIYKIIIAEAEKNAKFSWYQGWEQTSGYIKSELRGDCRFGNCRIYSKWEKKKPPTEEQIKVEIQKVIDDLLDNRDHHSTQRDFTHYVLETFYADITKAKHDVMMHLEDCLSVLITAIEKSENFADLKIQSFHNELKNFECTISDHEALSCFLEKGRKRIGET